LKILLLLNTKKVVKNKTQPKQLKQREKYVHTLLSTNKKHAKQKKKHSKKREKNLLLN